MVRHSTHPARVPAMLMHGGATDSAEHILPDWGEGGGEGVTVV